MEKEGGVRVQAKGFHQDSLSLIKFVETQKEQQSHSQGHLEGEKTGVRGQHSSCQSFSSSTAQTPAPHFVPLSSCTDCGLLYVSSF